MDNNLQNSQETNPVTNQPGGQMSRIGMGGMGMGGGRGMKPGEKPRNFGKSWKKIIAYCKPYLLAIIIALMLTMAGSILIIIGPNRLKEITDLIAEGIMGDINLTAIAIIGIFLVVIYGLGALFSYMQTYIMATVTQKLSRKLRNSISEKINRMPIKYFDSNSYGNVLSRITNDVDLIGQTLGQSLGQLIAGTTLFTGAVVMMLITNYWMALAAIGASIIGFAAMLIITTKSQKYFIRRQVQLGAIQGHIEETYSGHNVVKAYNGEKEAKDIFDNINRKLAKATRKSRFLSGMMLPIMSFIGNFGYVAVCIVGAVLVINGDITFGVIVAFMMYVRLFTQPLTQFAQAATNLQSTAASSERVFEFLDESEMASESNKTLTLSNVKGDVLFEHVKFAYDPGKPVINNFSAHAKPGQKVAIVGPTGAGKTTLVNLLMRFYELNEGVIKIDGIPTVELTRQNVHSLFCMVLQDTWLFEGTIKENIIYSKQGISDEQVVKAAQAVGLDHFIRTLPQGYDTMLDERASLSDGQKQLVTIARAMVENAPMLILDEATSSVDTRTEVLIQEAMDKLTRGRTSFVIAHRLSTIKNADLILVMKDGDIVESGNHEQLLGQNGFYAELYNSQFETID